MTLPVILASASKSRRALLAGAGIAAKAVPPNLDETAAKAAFRADGLPIREQAMRLAELKAVKISRRHAGLVVGGDQMLALEDRAFDKPADINEARAHLRQLSGRAHSLETALVVCEGGVPVWRHLSSPTLTMRTLSEAFIDTYLQQTGEEILTTVGAYQLEEQGAQLFSKIEGDYFSILGLPLLPLLAYFRERGIIPS